jgi:hypothetical protein
MGSKEKFQIGKVELEYTPHHTERRFELPILKHFLDKFYGDENLIEIGAVSLYTFPKVNHKVYDPGDTSGNSLIIHEFAENLNYKDKHVCSVSTIEHIGQAGYGLPRSSAYRAITVLNMIMESKNYLLTWPMGFNKLLDSYVEKILTINNDGNIRVFKRDEDNNWEITNPRSFDFRYGKPYAYGNAVIIITNQEELL